MANVTRRYCLRGPTSAWLEQFIDPPIVIAATYPVTILDITIDNSKIDDLDNLMSRLGYEFSATASPKQVFQYVATGAEANPFTIGAGEGFDARVTANYNVQVTLMRPGANALKLVSVVDGSMTVAQFNVELSDDIEAGDILMFTVEDWT